MQSIFFNELPSDLYDSTVIAANYFSAEQVNVGEMNQKLPTNSFM